MELHRPFDALGAIDSSSPAAVARAIEAMLAARIEGFDSAFLHEAFDNVARLYAGEREGFLPCDTPYHDLRHALDTALATARLVDGWEIALAGSRGSLGPELALLAVILALLHDVGLLRRDEERDLRGAALLKEHEARGALFAERYLERSPLRAMAPLARLIAATRAGCDMASFEGGEAHRVVARMLATADSLARLADRCHLEKCRDFLYAELVEAGIPCRSPEVLLARAPAFYDRHVLSRLDRDLAGMHRLTRVHFAGLDPYGDAIERNLRYLDTIVSSADFGLLRRKPVPVYGT